MLNRSGVEAVIRSIEQRADKSPRIKITRRHSEELMRQLAGASGQQTASTPRPQEHATRCIGFPSRSLRSFHSVWAGPLVIK